MKKLFISSIILLVAIQFSFSQNLQAYLSYATFYSSEQHTPYIETYISINPKTIQYKKIDDENVFQGSVLITMIFKQDGKVVTFDKYNLNSPKLSDTTSINSSFLDQKRYALPNGDYQFEITIADNNSNNSPYILTEEFSLTYSEDIASISDFQMIDKYYKTKSPNALSKGAYDIIPYSSNYYPQNKDDIIFLFEIYNTDKLLGENEDMLIKFYIESYYDNSIVPQYVIAKKKKAKPLLTMLKKFSIDSLPSGNYNLVAAVLNRDNEVLIQKKYFFQRNNGIVSQEDPIVNNAGFASSITNKDSLLYYVHTLHPIANEAEKSFIDNNLSDYDVHIMQQFLFRFWSLRDPINPNKLWNNYKKKVRIANNDFSFLNTKGYMTDRGSVYLRFGKPNTIIRNYMESGAYPHEIWHYYNIGSKYRDVKFVFYTHDMVLSDFQLVHSNLPGEVKNRQWRLIVRYRTISGKDVDDDQDYDEYDDYNNPY